MAIKQTPKYSAVDGAYVSLEKLAQICRDQLPEAFLSNIGNVVFVSQANPGDDVYFPCPLKEQEAAGAIKALEACAAASIADLRYGSPAKPHKIVVDIDRIACFLISAYLSTIDGMDKQTPGVKDKIPDTDLNQAQSILYRRLSANLYETSCPGEYYHIHGSLDASTTLSMLGLPTHQPNLTRYQDCIDTIARAVQQFTVGQLESLNALHRQAGVPALHWESYLASPHGSVLSTLPPLTVTQTERKTLATPFPGAQTSKSGPVGYTRSSVCGALEGIKVLELCRVIAGPTIGRSLAAHGASVLKVTSQHLPDVPFFQVDVNTGKHCCSLDLKTDADQKVFLSLLAEADVILDGYRPGVLGHLGVSAGELARLGTERGKGYVYVSEDCFGGAGLEKQVSGSKDMDKLEWKQRPGWQQIADCVTGVAWLQGQFMGLSEPVVPPFPMSDYGTGALGALAALAGLWRREKYGGSWACRTSLCQYDIFVMSLGQYPPEVQRRLKEEHDGDFFELRHSDSVDEVSRRALRSVRKLHPHLFSEDIMAHCWSDGFKAEIRWPKEAVSIEGVKVGHVRPSRPNGADAAKWGEWEVDPILELSASR